MMDEGEGVEGSISKGRSPTRTSHLFFLALVFVMRVTRIVLTLSSACLLYWRFCRLYCTVQPSQWNTDANPSFILTAELACCPYCTFLPNWEVDPERLPMKRRTPSTSSSGSSSIGMASHPPPPHHPKKQPVVTRVGRLFSRDATAEHSQHVRIRVDEPPYDSNNNSNDNAGDQNADDDHKDGFSYAILIALYTLQGIPMGLSASIPFLIQQKIRLAASSSSLAASSHIALQAGTAAAAAVDPALAARAAARLSYKANAIFALCSWPFSLKLLWAPLVDSCFVQGFGRRKSWLVPVQALAGILMVLGSGFVERQLGLGNGGTATGGLPHTVGESINVKGVTAFFFALYFLMATQDIAVDGWALTMLSKKNRGRGPVCNSIGQNIGYFLSFVGFLALNDAESSEALWRPLLRLKSDPENGLVSLGSFIRFMGYFMLVTTTAVALFKHEASSSSSSSSSVPSSATVWNPKKLEDDEDDKDKELDASEIGLKETYHRLWAVCKLPSVRWLFLVLLTYRLPTSLGDNVKFLKAVEFGLSKSTTAVSVV